MMFKFNNGEVPKPISDLFVLNRFFHNHNTKSVGYLQTPLGRRAASYRTFSYIGSRHSYLESYVTKCINQCSKKCTPPPPPPTLHVQTKVLYFNSHTNVML